MSAPSPSPRPLAAVEEARTRGFQRIHFSITSIINVTSIVIHSIVILTASTAISIITRTFIQKTRGLWGVIRVIGISGLKIQGPY